MAARGMLIQPEIIISKDQERKKKKKAQEAKDISPNVLSLAHLASTTIHPEKRLLTTLTRETLKSE